MKKTERINAAKDTLEYLKQGYYYVDDKKICIEDIHKKSMENSFLVTPAESEEIVEKYKGSKLSEKAKISIVNVETVKAVLDLASENVSNIGVLNFASAKNPGGGFLNGALAQEESIAVGTGLYDTQLKNEEYYLANRAFKSMMYTDNMIYSKDVVFIRDEKLNLLSEPVTASIITAPAVNYGQVLLKREDPILAKKVMKNRMRKVLALFAHKGDKNIILGAYGCGVFRNDPALVAEYWSELLYDENFISYFDKIIFAILDRSKDKSCLQAFEKKISF